VALGDERVRGHSGDARLDRSARARRRAPLIALLLALTTLVALAWLRPASSGIGPLLHVRAQGAATVTPVAGPAAVSIEGRWSVTRSWYRRCPACGMPVVRTTTWDITVLSDSVRVAGGPRGTVRGDGAGGGLVDLEGLESAAGSTMRFHYATLRVGPDGLRMEGGFAGSERLANPCGSIPPTVTCFVDAGWLRATRLDVTPVPTGPPPPGPPTPIATASATATATVISAPATPTATLTLPPTVTRTATATAGASPRPSATPSAAPTIATVAAPRRHVIGLPLLSPSAR